MRFGLFVPQGWRLDLTGIPPADQWQTMSAVAARADAGPWDSIWVYDHFHTVPLPTEEATHEAWSLIAAFAATTSRVKLGQMCTSMSYRNPMYLAKVAATCDLISGGRIQMGIGGGWYEHEWRAYGYGFPSAGERLGRLDEGVQIMRQAWTTGRADFAGKHYTVDGAICAPQPPAGDIPVWIAGGGEKKTLRIAAKYADYTNFDGTPEGFVHKSGVLQQHCAEVGRDFDAITRTADYNVVLAETEAEVEAKLSAIEAAMAKYVDPAAASASMGAFRGMPGVGTPEQVIENLSALGKSGLEYAICYVADAAGESETLDLLEQKVIPALS